MSDDWDLFEKTVDRLTSTCSGAALDDGLDELGWADALAVDEQRSVASLFEAQGRTSATSHALGLVVAAHLGEPVPDAQVAFPPIRQWTAAGRLVNGALDVGGVVLGPLRETVAVAVERNGSSELVVVDAAQLTARPITGMDPDLALVEVVAAGLPVGETFPTGAWSDAVAAGQRALAHQLVGAAETMLGLARHHAVERIQFGQPIAAFQAVRHRLAEAYVAIEAARAALEGAWLDGTAFTAAVAKAVAGRNARVVARHAQQVLAGIGFTAEHPFHHHVRRVFVLDALLGDAKALTRDVGQKLLDARRLPDLLPL